MNRNNHQFVFAILLLQTHEGLSSNRAIWATHPGHFLHQNGSAGYIQAWVGNQDGLLFAGGKQQNNRTEEKEDIFHCKKFNLWQSTMILVILMILSGL